MSHRDDGMGLATVLAILDRGRPPRSQPGRGCAWLLLLGSIAIVALWWLSR